MTLQLRADVSTADTEEGTVLLDERSGRYWQLNPTGALVLRLLLDDLAPYEISQNLAEHHPVSIHQALADITALLQHLRTAGLVTEDGRS